MKSQEVVKEQLLASLKGHQAHAEFDDVVKNLPVDLRNARVPNVPYTLWHLLEHIRLTQYDILDFIRNPEYKEMEWPKAYWPDEDAEADEKAWKKTIADFRKDRKELAELVSDPKTDFYAKIPHGSGQHILREILLVVDHTAYHLGEFLVMRRMLGAWPAK